MTYSLFPAAPFVEAGMDDAEIAECAGAWIYYDEDVQGQVNEVAGSPLATRRKAVVAWRKTTWGLPGAADAEPRP